MRQLPRQVDVAVVGAGFAGIGVAARLLEDGIDDLIVLERADDVGGCWRDNTYPGCQCDVPTALYSFSFLQEPNWSRTYALQAEIHAYLRRAVVELGVEPHLHLETEVLEAAWDDDAARWRITTSRGELVARVLVSGAGPLTEPVLPDVRGMDQFEGESMHSARWRADVPLEGRRVAVVGTGASAIQIVPKLQPLVERLVVFQRTPPWVLPHRDRPVRPLERFAWQRFPFLQRAARALAYWSRESLARSFTGNGAALRVLERLGRWNLCRTIVDPDLRARLEPTYRVGCKRLLMSNEWYPALVAPNTDVVTSAVAELRPRSVVAADGSEHEVDVIVFATGFEVTEPPIATRVRGRDGRTLADTWNGTPQAYLGTAVTGFPNLFLLVGPGTGLGHNSIVFMIESQVRYVRSAMRAMRTAGVEAVEVRPQVQEAFDADVQRRMEGSVWTSGGCRSWYLDSSGRNRTLWPASTVRYRMLLRRFDLRDYVARPGAVTPGPAPAAAPDAVPAALP